jgi:hypothetical protein
MSIQFNQELSGAIGFTQNITPTINVLTPQSTMNNLHIDFVAWEELIQKPRGNILTGPLAITVSTVKNGTHSKFSKITEVNRVPQFIKTMNEEIKISLSVLVII